MSDFTLPPEPENRQPWEELRTYQASITQGDVRAIISFRWYSGQAHQYQPNQWLYPPGYVMDRRTSRADERYGTMGRKQEERAKALFPLLEEEVRSALFEASWRVIGTSRINGDVWWYFGQAIIEQEERLHALAQRVWHGSYPRQGAEKVTPLEDSLLLQAFPANLWQAIGKDLEAAVDPDAKLLRVRRKRQVGSAKEQQRAAETTRVAVIGDEEARARGAAPAFQRTRATREITFKCAWCTQTVTQQRYPSPKPMYCSDTCEQEAQREKTRIRVQRLREKRRDATKQ
jgi:hypothetical protein